MHAQHGRSKKEPSSPISFIAFTTLHHLRPHMLSVTVLLYDKSPKPVIGAVDGAKSFANSAGFANIHPWHHIIPSSLPLPSIHTTFNRCGINIPLSSFVYCGKSSTALRTAAKIRNTVNLIINWGREQKCEQQ